MNFLRIFARIVVEAWRQLDGEAITPRRFLIAFEIVADRAIDRLTMHGVVDAMIARGVLRGSDVA